MPKASGQAACDPPSAEARLHRRVEAACRRVEPRLVGRRAPLARAARDYAEKQPAFATGAGLLSLQWLTQGYGYEITSVDVRDAYRAALAAAEHHGSSAEVKERIRRLVAAEQAGGFVVTVLGRELGQ